MYSQETFTADIDFNRGDAGSKKMLIIKTL